MGRRGVRSRERVARSRRGRRPTPQVAPRSDAPSRDLDPRDDGRRTDGYLVDAAPAGRGSGPAPWKEFPRAPAAPTESELNTDLQTARAELDRQRKRRGVPPPPPIVRLAGEIYRLADLAPLLRRPRRERSRPRERMFPGPKASPRIPFAPLSCRPAHR